MRYALAAGDFAAFLAFAVIGLNSHDEAFNVANLVRAAGVFAVVWLCLALAFGLYGRPTAGLRRIGAVWLLAWALGLAGRTAFFERPPKLGFAVVALLFNGAALLAWRALAARRLRPATGRPDAAKPAS